MTHISSPKAATPFHHGDLAQALLTAAAGLIAVRGTTEFSLREVAESVGVTHTAAYRHFRSKTQLLVKIAIEGFGALTQVIAEAAKGASPGPNRLTAMGQAYIDFAVAHPGAYRTMFHPSLCNEGADAELQAAGIEALALTQAAVADGQQMGLIRLDMDADVVAASLWAAQHGYAGLLIDGILAETANVAHAPRVDRALFMRLLVESLSRS